MTFLEQIKSDFNLYTAQASDDNFARLRKNAFAAYEQLGIPTTQLEEWKYSNLRSVQQGNFTTSCVSKLDANALIKAGILNKIVANKLVFVNGCLFPELSVWLETDERIKVCSLAQARKEHSAIFDAHFGKYIDFSKEGLLALNTALMSDGAFVFVPEGASLTHPLMITNITDAIEHSVFQQPRNLIIIEKMHSVSYLVMSFFS
jgi:Fe-S cluster assembly protein SufD